MKRLFSAAAAACFALSVAQGAEAAGGPSHAKPGPALSVLSIAPQVAANLSFKTSKEAIGPVKTVAIPYFQVQVVNSSKAHGYGANAASVDTSYVLSGLPPQAVQAMTDELYAQFVADLKAKGVTVLTTAEASAASPAYAKLMANAKPAPVSLKTADSAVSTFFTPTGLPIYFTSADTQNLSIAVAAGRTFFDERQAAKDLNAAVVGIRLMVNFVEQSGTTAGVLGFRPTVARVKSNVDISVEPVHTQMWVLTPTSKQPLGMPGDRTRYELSAPLLVQGRALLGASNVTSAGTQAGDAMANLIGALGGAGSYKTTDYVVTVDPVAYQKEVGGVLKAVNRLFVDNLAVGP
jgi:hypothetical protein